MAGVTDNVNKTLSVIATTSNKIQDLVIKDGQLIFIHDIGRIAFDFKGKRTFYNQIIELESDTERINMQNPVNGQYYFVIETGVLWRYSNCWSQVTNTFNDTIFIGDVFPQSGETNKLYVNKTNKEIYIWDENTNGYTVISNQTNINSIENSEIELLFS